MLFFARRLPSTGICFALAPAHDVWAIRNATGGAAQSEGSRIGKVNDHNDLYCLRDVQACFLSGRDRQLLLQFSHMSAGAQHRRCDMLASTILRCLCSGDQLIKCQATKEGCVPQICARWRTSSAKMQAINFWFCVSGS